VRTWRPERDRRVIVIVDAGRAGAGRVDDEPRLDTFIESALLLGALAAAAGDRVDLAVLDDGVRGRVHGATRADVVQRFGETLALAEPGLAATEWSAVPALVDSITTARAFVVLVSSLDSVGASGDLLAVLPRLTRRHAVLVTSVTDPAVQRMASAALEPATSERGSRAGGKPGLPSGAERGRRAGGKPGLPSGAERGRRAGGKPGLPSGAERDVYRRAAAERTLLDADGVADVARRAGAEVVRAVPEQVPPLVADAYIRAKATGRL
jgi:uncharacterized protein (DUF58 family)